MKFDTPATTNPIDQLKIIGKPTDRIDGPLKTSGAAPYAYERYDVAPNAAYGYIVGEDFQKTPAMVGLVMKLFRDPDDEAREVRELCCQ